MDNQTEIWKDIPGYEGLYQASSFGRFKALDKIYYCGNPSTKRFKAAHIMKFGFHRLGYLTITLMKNAKSKHFYAHNLTAKVFIPNPRNKKEINHIDGNKQNNHISNLEWSTRSENIQHAFDTGLKMSFKDSNHPMAKMVLDLRTGIYYGTLKEAAKARGMTYAHAIYNFSVNCPINKTDLIYV